MREKKLLAEIAANTRATPKASTTTGSIRTYVIANTGNFSNGRQLCALTVPEDRVYRLRGMYCQADRIAGAAAGDLIYGTFRNADGSIYAWYVHSQAPDALEWYAFTPGIGHTAAAGTINMDPLPDVIMYPYESMTLVADYGANTGRVYQGLVTWFDYSLKEWSEQ